MTESCEETRARLEAWIDQALPEAEQRRLQEHLSGCAKCRSEEAELRGLATALGDLRLEPESPRMWARIRTAVLSEHCQANRIVPWVLAPNCATNARLLNRHFCGNLCFATSTYIRMLRCQPLENISASAFPIFISNH